MILTAAEIKQELDQRRLIIEPFETCLLRHASYVLNLGNRFRRWRQATEIDLWEPEDSGLEPVLESNVLPLASGEFVLGQTKELVGLPENLAGFLFTLSHLGRFGLSCAQNSVHVRPGFGRIRPSHLTLEMSSVNPSPLRLMAGMPVCHLVLFRCAGNDAKDGLLARPLPSSVYEGQDPLVYPQLRKEFARPPRASSE